jgi:hypothetical protein
MLLQKTPKTNRDITVLLAVRPKKIADNSLYPC